MWVFILSFIPTSNLSCCLYVEGRLIALHSQVILNLVSSKCGYVRLAWTKPLSIWCTGRAMFRHTHMYVKNKTKETHTRTHPYRAAKTAIKCQSSAQSNSPETDRRAVVTGQRILIKPEFCQSTAHLFFFFLHTKSN